MAEAENGKIKCTGRYANEKTGNGNGSCRHDGTEHARRFAVQADEESYDPITIQFWNAGPDQTDRF